MITSIRLALALILILLLTLLLVPVQWSLVAFSNSKWSGILPQFWHKTVLRLIGVKVSVIGKFSDAHPLLLVCNHISWVDILVMGSVRRLCFVAKSEIGGWPIISQLAKLQGTVFIDRTNSRDAANQADTIAGRLLQGDVMVLFAEGTTGDGNKILPFNSSLFGAAQYAVRNSKLQKAVVQPVAISYTRLHGQPLGRRFQSYASWPGDVGLLPHLKTFLSKSAFDVDVVLGHALELGVETNRKVISRQAMAQVTQMFGGSVAGRVQRDFQNTEEREVSLST